MFRVRAIALALLVLLGGVSSACSGDDLDCSLGAMKATCPPGTVGFDRMAARLRSAQRVCLQDGLEPESEAYAACLAAAGPARPPSRGARFDHVGPAQGPPAP